MTDLVASQKNAGIGRANTAYPVGQTIKRIFDIFFAAFSIVLLAPLLLLCAFACSLSSPGPIIFRHRRVGFNGKHFDCFKFRTMQPNAQELLRVYLASNPGAAAEWASSHKLQFDPRVTGVGAILRKTSLDELPQLFNVLLGDMSIVGPRPITEEELVRYSTNVGDYFACRPGITGLWQVSGRSQTVYGKRVICDAFYARNWSLKLDAKIVLLTIPALLDSESAY